MVINYKHHWIIWSWINWIDDGIYGFTLIFYEAKYIMKSLIDKETKIFLQN